MITTMYRSLLLLGVVFLPSQSFSQTTVPAATDTPLPPPGPYISISDPFLEGSKALKSNPARETPIVIESTEKDFPPVDFDPEKTSNPAPAGEKPTIEPEAARAATAPTNIDEKPEMPDKAENKVNAGRDAAKKPDYVPADAAAISVVEDDKPSPPLADKPTVEIEAPAPKELSEKPAPTNASKSEAAEASAVEAPVADKAKSEKASKEAVAEKPDYAPPGIAKIQNEEKPELKEAETKQPAGKVADEKPVAQPEYAPDNTAKLPKAEKAAPPAGTEMPTTDARPGAEKETGIAAKPVVPRQPDARPAVPPTVNYQQWPPRTQPYYPQPRYWQPYPYGQRGYAPVPQVPAAQYPAQPNWYPNWQQPRYQPQYQPNYRQPYQPGFQPGYRPQYQPQYQPRYQPQYRPNYWPQNNQYQGQSRRSGG